MADGFCEVEARANIDGGAIGKGTVFVKSSRGTVGSCSFEVLAQKRGDVKIENADASCSTPASFDVWLTTGGAHKGLVAETVTFVKGTRPGSGAVAGNAMGGG